MSPVDDEISDLAMDVFWKYAAPNRFIALSTGIIPVLLPLTLGIIIISLVWGFFFTPDDYRQGASVKIIYVHVPTAMMAINAWICMVVASIIWLVRRHVVSALVARSAAPIGAVFTIIAIATGAVWGKPIWGTYWAWDPRLTSFFVLFFFYLGYLGLWSAIENRDLAANVTSILAIVGSVFALLSRYAVNFWAQGLHQAASLSLDRETHVANVFYWPLVGSIIGFILLFVLLVLVGTRNEIWQVQIQNEKIRKQL